MTGIFNSQVRDAKFSPVGGNEIKSSRGNADVAASGGVEFETVSIHGFFPEI